MLMAAEGQLMLFSLILMRMTGFIVFNPLLGRKSVPNLIKGGMIMVLTLLLFSFSAGNVPEPVNSIEFAILLLKEFFMGFVIGFVMDLFLMIYSFSGSIIDYQMGLSMATVYDPQSNAQTALSGGIWNAYFIMLFFAVDGHLALFKILITSSEVVPYGAVRIAPEASWAILEIFIECIMIAVKFSVPIVAIEFLAELAVGILMKMIPQINVFIVNIQAKVVIGFLMLLFLFTPMSDYLGNMVSEMLLTIQDIIRLL